MEVAMRFWEFIKLLFQRDEFRCVEINSARLIKALRYSEEMKALKKTETAQS